MVSNRPDPVFDNKSLVEHKLVIPVIAEWLATTKQTLSDWQRLPKAVVQLLNFTIDSFSDDTWVQVSDGTMWVPAVLNKEMAKLYRSGHLQNYDLVHLLKSDGHCYSGNTIVTLVCYSHIIN